MLYANNYYVAFMTRCDFGILKSCYGEGDLEKYEGDIRLNVQDWSTLPRISLREAE